MKRLALILYHLIIIAYTSVAQNFIDTVYIEKNYETSREKPIQVNANSLIYNLADSVFIVNHIRYTLYDKLFNFIKDPANDIGCDKIISQFENYLKSSDEQYELLSNNCKLQSDLYKTTIETTRQSLIQVGNSLNLTQNALISANAALDKATDLLKKDRTKRFFEKLTIFGSGIGIGILTGIILIK